MWLFIVFCRLAFVTILLIAPPAASQGLLPLDFDLDAEWHFFATSHGKGPCDAAGGSIKRIVTKASLQKTIKNHILTPEDMFIFCKENIKNIIFFYVSKEQIEDIGTRILNHRFENLKPVKQTRSFHCFIPNDNSSIQAREYSFDESFRDFRLLKWMSFESFHIWGKVIVIY